jgi:hypothetical protein
MRRRKYLLRLDAAERAFFYDGTSVRKAPGTIVGRSVSNSYLVRTSNCTSAVPSDSMSYRPAGHGSSLKHLYTPARLKGAAIAVMVCSRFRRVSG